MLNICSCLLAIKIISLCFKLYIKIASTSYLLWKCENVSCLVVSDSLDPHGLESTRLLYPWNSPGKNTGAVAISFSRGSSQPRDWTQPTVQDGSLFSTPSLAFIVCRLFDGGHSDQCEMILHCRSLIISDLSVFSCVISHLYVFFREMSV